MLARLTKRGFARARRVIRGGAARATVAWEPAKFTFYPHADKSRDKIPRKIEDGPTSVIAVTDGCINIFRLKRAHRVSIHPEMKVLKKLGESEFSATGWHSGHRYQIVRLSSE